VSSFYADVVIEGPDLLGLARHADLGMIDHNPAANIRRPDVSDTPQGRGLDKAELKAILAAATAAGHRDAAVLQALSGLRVSSVCAANTGDLGHQGRHRVLTYWLSATAPHRPCSPPTP
jgi:hypothetical protein